MRLALLFLAIVLVTIGGASGQNVSDPELVKQLQKLFPSAATFSTKAGSPQVYKAFGPAQSGRTGELLGFAYWTTEIEPLERGFDGPIKMLVGMNTTGILTGVIVTENREPYGYFSVDTPEFAAQFKNKNIRDAFKVGVDVDAISRATISVTSASRAIRNSSRKVARAYLAPPGTSAPAAPSGQ
ncbi:MAG TPA: FMN-binding protein [Gammaproteobacteria bacterium]|nr:FMN-binding protein [Gammaproteobacteria bacterium]